MCDAQNNFDFESIEPHPDRKDAQVVVFKERYVAENVSSHRPYLTPTSPHSPLTHHHITDTVQNSSSPHPPTSPPSARSSSPGSPTRLFLPFLRPPRRLRRRLQRRGMRIQRWAGATPRARSSSRARGRARRRWTTTSRTTRTGGWPTSRARYLGRFGEMWFDFSTGGLIFYDDRLMGFFSGFLFRGACGACTMDEMVVRLTWAFRGCNIDVCRWARSAVRIRACVRA